MRESGQEHVAWAAPTWLNLPRPLLILIVARCVNRLGGFSMAFLGVHLSLDLGADLVTVGVILTVFGVCTIPSRLAGGALADRLGARSTLLVGLLACAAAQLVIAAASSVVLAAVGVALLGLAYEIIEPPSQALVADLSDSEHLPSAYALVGSSLAVAGVVAGLIGAVVTTTVGIPWLFVVDALTCGLCALLVALGLRLPATSSRADRTNRGSSSLRAAARDRKLLRHTAIGTAFAGIYMVAMFALPLTVEARGLPVETTGIVLAAEALAAMAVQPLVGHVRRRLGSDHATVRFGLIVVGIGLAGTAMAAHPGLLAASLAMVSAGSVLVLGHLQAGAARLAPPWARAAYLAVFGLSWGLATTVAPIVVTSLLDLGAAWPWVAASGAAVVLAVSVGGATQRSEVHHLRAARAHPHGPHDG